METMTEPDYKDAARRLWMLLDDIDTLDDACRTDDAAFRKCTRGVQRKRFAILSGEHMDVLLAHGPSRTAALPSAPPAPAQKPTRHCGSHECKAAQQDGILCADGECRDADADGVPGTSNDQGENHG